MDKSSFISQFQHMSGLIQKAVADQDFGRIAAIENARKDLLHTFASENEPDNDPQFYEALEACAKEHADAMLQITNDLQAMKKRSRKTLKSLAMYDV
tara:strand:+ start:22 stop:312 length:291 start_codon:yes stop_codon:yes gene_type:complete